MTNNQRGGIISKLLIIPVAVAFMAGFFFLGYYVGKYQSKTNQSEVVVPLPDVVSDNLPKNSDFTFFKTLTDKDNKTVSIDLKPKKSHGETEKKASGQREESANTEASKEQDAKSQSSRKETAKTGGSRIRYTLQLASYQEKKVADADVRKMKQAGFAAFVVSSEVPGKGTWYRVRVGSFSNKDAAEKLQREVRAKAGASSFVTLE